MKERSDNASITTSEKRRQYKRFNERTPPIVCDEYNALMANSLVTSLENGRRFGIKNIGLGRDYYGLPLTEKTVGWVECHSVMDNAGWLTIYVRRLSRQRVW